MLKLTRAAILAFLKKNRKSLQIWEAGRLKAKGMGIPERSFLQKDPSVIAKMGNVGRAKGKGYGITPAEQRFGDLVTQTGATKKVLNKIASQMKKKRRKVTSAAKKFRGMGGQLSEYKGPNPVYQTVKKLRKLMPKKRKKTEAPTMFNYPG